MKNKNKDYHIARTPRELGKLIGLSESEMDLIKYKVKLSALAVKAIKESELGVSEISKKSGVARSKVSAVKNNAGVGVSCDLLIKIISATGLKMAAPTAA